MSLYEIVFSPTGGTKKAADCLTAALAGDAVIADLAASRWDPDTVTLKEEDVAVIGVPSYGGRVPAAAAGRLRRVRGNGARAVLVCVYGNRAYDDTLAELSGIVKQAGFRVTAAVAAIAEHSIARQFAAGRPDARDAKLLAGFAGKIQHKISAEDGAEPVIPGSFPEEKAVSAGPVPAASEACNGCGVCAAGCPVQAIDPQDPKTVDGKVCISCMRCVSLCPQHARSIAPDTLAAISAMLEKACSGRKECELFL